jgi:hypothetical protein
MSTLRFLMPSKVVKKKKKKIIFLFRLDTLKSCYLFFYYIDRCELWGFIREINSGIFICENISFFPAGTTFT